MFKELVQLFNNNNEKFVVIGNDEKVLVINMSNKYYTTCFDDVWQFFLWLHDSLSTYFEDIERLLDSFDCSKEFLENITEYLETVGIYDLTPEQVILYGVFKYKLAEMKEK